LDGFSLRSLLENPAANQWDGPNLSVAASGSKVPFQKDQPARAEDQHFSLRSEHFRYIRCRNGEEEFYDHRSDPNEWHNEVGNPAYKTEIQAMREAFEQFLKDARS
jgi:hypothetical protein